jgi:hypothetical protein
VRAGRSGDLLGGALGEQLAAPGDQVDDPVCGLDHVELWHRCSGAPRPLPELRSSRFSATGERKFGCRISTDAGARREGRSRGRGLPQFVSMKAGVSSTVAETTASVAKRESGEPAAGPEPNRERTPTCGGVRRRVRWSQPCLGRASSRSASSASCATAQPIRVARASWPAPCALPRPQLTSFRFVPAAANAAGTAARTKQRHVASHTRVPPLGHSLGQTRPHWPVSGPSARACDAVIYDLFAGIFGSAPSRPLSLHTREVAGSKPAAPCEIRLTAGTAVDSWVHSWVQTPAPAPAPRLIWEPLGQRKARDLIWQRPA